MSAILFTVFGRAIKGKHVAYLVLGLIVAGLVYLAYSKVAGHFQHINDIETANQKLSDDKAALEGRNEDLVKLNQDNALQADTIQKQKDASVEIATTEQKTSAVRAKKYEEIIHDIAASPSPNDPVPADISNSLDSLWD